MIVFYRQSAHERVFEQGAPQPSRQHQRQYGENTVNTSVSTVLYDRTKRMNLTQWWSLVCGRQRHCYQRTYCRTWKWSQTPNNNCLSHRSASISRPIPFSIYCWRKVEIQTSRSTMYGPYTGRRKSGLAVWATPESCHSRTSCCRLLRYLACRTVNYCKLWLKLTKKKQKPLTLSQPPKHDSFLF